MVGFSPCKIVRCMDNIKLECQQIFGYLFLQYDLVDKYINNIKENKLNKPKLHYLYNNKINSFIRPQQSTQKQMVRMQSLYTPCNHDSNSKCIKGSCHPANQNIQYCDKFCGCTRECPMFRPICQCIGECSTSICPCHRAMMECDPAECKCVRVPSKFCRNVQIQL